MSQEGCSTSSGGAGSPANWSVAAQHWVRLCGEILLRPDSASPSAASGQPGQAAGTATCQQCTRSVHERTRFGGLLAQLFHQLQILQRVPAVQRTTQRCGIRVCIELLSGSCAGQLLNAAPDLSAGTCQQRPHPAGGFHGCWAPNPCTLQCNMHPDAFSAQPGSLSLKNRPRRHETHGEKINICKAAHPPLGRLLLLCLLGAPPLPLLPLHSFLQGGRPSPRVLQRLCTELRCHTSRLSCSDVAGARLTYRRRTVNGLGLRWHDTSQLETQLLLSALLPLLGPLKTSTLALNRAH